MTGDASDSTLTERPRERQTSRRLHIVDEGSLHHYRTEIPNTIIRGRKGRGLSVYAKFLYVYLKSVAGDSGLCFQSTATIAHETELSVGRVHEAKHELAQRGLISITHGRNPRRHADRMRIKDIWPANMFEFSQRARQPEEEACEPQEEPSQVATTPDAGESIRTANTAQAPELSQAPDELADDAAVFTRRIQCSPGEYSVHQANGRRSPEKDSIKNGEGEGTHTRMRWKALHRSRLPGSIAFHKTGGPRLRLSPSQHKIIPHWILDRLTRKFLTITFRRAVLDPLLRWQHFLYEEEEHAADLVRRYPTRAQPQPLLHESLSQGTSDTARAVERLLQRKFPPQPEEHPYATDKSRLLPRYRGLADDGRSVSRPAVGNPGGHVLDGVATRVEPGGVGLRLPHGPEGARASPKFRFQPS